MARTSTQELAQLISKHRPDWDGAGFPPWLRARVAAHVASMRATGAPLAGLCADLGVSAPTLRRWMRAESADESGGFARVIIDDGVPATRPPKVDAVSTLRLTTPGGFVLEGLTFEQSIAALEALR